jgi:hypothetical protein
MIQANILSIHGIQRNFILDTLHILSSTMDKEKHKSMSDNPQCSSESLWKKECTERKPVDEHLCQTDFWVHIHWKQMPWKVLSPAMQMQHLRACDLTIFMKTVQQVDHPSELSQLRKPCPTKWCTQRMHCEKVPLSLCQIGCWSTKLHNNVPYPILMQISNRNRKHSVEA